MSSQLLDLKMDASRLQMRLKKVGKGSLEYIDLEAQLKKLRNEVIALGQHQDKSKGFAK
jgi:hypothetical protein